MPEQNLKPKNPGQWVKGQSGNPKGRPKGSKNAMTLLRQKLELELRENAAPEMGAVLEKAIEMAKEGHPGMIKLLLELHMHKGSPDEKEAKEKVEININAKDPVTPVTVIEAPFEDITDET